MHKHILLVSLSILVAACARLDHIQIGDIDQSQGALSPVSVMVSESGIELSTIADISGQAGLELLIKGLNLPANQNTKLHSEDLSTLLSLINLGPRTGNPVYDDRYAEHVLKMLYVQCPSGKLTGIRSIREADSYGPISGEVVRLDAFCIL